MQIHCIANNYNNKRQTQNEIFELETVSNSGFQFSPLHFSGLHYICTHLNFLTCLSNPYIMYFQFNSKAKKINTFS